MLASLFEVVIVYEVAAEILGENSFTTIFDCKYDTVVSINLSYCFKCDLIYPINETEIT